MSDIQKGRLYILTRNNRNQVVHIDQKHDNNSKKNLFFLILSLKRITQMKNIIPTIFSYLKKWVYHPPLYEYHYGIYSFHEGYCYSSKLRRLNEHETKLKKEGRFIELPNEMLNINTN